MKLTSFKRPKLFKKLNAPYRMVFIDDESMNEVASFRLTKRSVYILFSTLFVMIIAVTVSILLFTPLKYYIPGYGNNKTRVQLIQMKQKVDSLSDILLAQQKQVQNIKNVINGNTDMQRDTAMLKPEQIRTEAMSSIVPAPAEIKKEAIETERKNNRNKKARK